MTEFTFLGAGDSCQTLGSGNTSLIVRSGQHTMIADLSCNLAAAVDADAETVILTHEHIDHVYGLPSFLHQSWLRGRTRPLKILVPPAMTYLPEGMLSLFALREKKNMFEISVLHAEAFSLGSVSVSFFRTDHTGCSVGLLLEEDGKRLVFTSDTRPVSPASVPAARADVLIHDASGTATERETLIQKGHSSGADAAALAAALQAKSLFLCHLPMENELSEAVLWEARQSFPNTFIPEILTPYTL